MNKVLIFMVFTGLLSSTLATASESPKPTRAAQKHETTEDISTSAEEGFNSGWFGTVYNYLPEAETVKKAAVIVLVVGMVAMPFLGLAALPLAKAQTLQQDDDDHGVRHVKIWGHEFVLGGSARVVSGPCGSTGASGELPGSPKPAAESTPAREELDWEKSVIDNKDGTITDLHTRLMWEKSSSSGLVTRSEAEAHCNNLETLGFTDWRVPTTGELENLKNGPEWRYRFLPRPFDFRGIVAWSAPKAVYGTSGAVGVEGDSLWKHPRSGIARDKAPVLCVRSL